MDSDLKDIFTECKIDLERVRNTLQLVDSEKFEDEIEAIDEVIDEMSEQILVIDIAEIISTNSKMSKKKIDKLYQTDMICIER